MAFNHVDEKDWAIIEILKTDSRISNSEIARRINVSEGTVRKRIEKLREEGIIKKFTVVLKSEGVEGMILIRTEPKRSREIYDILSKKFDEIFEFSGRFDLVIRVNCKSLEELNALVDEIRNINGVKSTDTLVRLH